MSHVVVYIPRSISTSKNEVRIMNVVQDTIRESAGIDTVVTISGVSSSVVDIKFFDFHLTLDVMYNLFDDVGSVVRSLIDQLTEENLTIKLILLSGTVSLNV